MKSEKLRILAQTVRDLLLKMPPKKGLGKIPGATLRRLENLLLRIGDPLIRWHYGDYSLELPLSHRLPLYMREYPHYSRNLGRIAACSKRKYAGLKIIDVGANIGDSVAIIRDQCECPILCIEGDAWYVELLKRNVQQFNDVEVVQAYLGEKSATKNAVAKNLGGTGSLVMSTGNIPEVTIRALDDVISSGSGFYEAKLLKIDTDGFDGNILRGAGGLIKRASPIIFFEYDPGLLAIQGDSGHALLDYINHVGYKSFLVYGNRGDLLCTIDGVSHDAMVDQIDSLYKRGKLDYLDICAFAGIDNDCFLELCASEGGLPYCATMISP